jgi:CBS domain-containing protein
MLVRETMTTDVVTATPQMSLHEAAAVLARHSITAMPVVDGAGFLVGVLSEVDVVREALVRDSRAHLLRVPLSEGPRATRVEQAMTRTPVTVPPETDLAEAVALMVELGVKSLPVTVGDRVVGVVSRKDVVAQLARRDDRVAAEVTTLVRACEARWSVTVVDGVVTFEGAEAEADRRLAESLVAGVRGVTGVRFGPARR